MILIATDKMYYNTQVYFRNHYIDKLPNDDKIWAETYAMWLAEQGAVIVPPTMLQLLKNSLGVSPLYDKFGFEREEDAIKFALRWS